MHISFFSAQKYEKPFFDEANINHQHEITYYDYHLNAKTINALGKTDVVCCFVNDRIDKPVIDVFDKLGVKLIALRSAGYNHVNVTYAASKGIKVCRVPSYSPEAVAEYAVGLLLCLNRKIHHAHNRVREGDFSLQGLMGFNLYQKTIGVIGTGQIGLAFCRIMTGFGCKVLAYDPIPNEDCIKLGVKYTDINTLLKNSDIISLHCPLNQDTEHMINTQSIEAMKDGVMIINTGRGKLIDTKAIINALKCRKIGYLGIDVYEEEEKLFFENHSEEIIEDDVFCRLLTFPNVLITGHQAFFTKEAMHNIANTTLENITNFACKGAPVHFVLPT